MIPHIDPSCVVRMFSTYHSFGRTLSPWVLCTHFSPVLMSVHSSTEAANDIYNNLLIEEEESKHDKLFSPLPTSTKSKNLLSSSSVTSTTNYVCPPTQSSKPSLLLKPSHKTSMTNSCTFAPRTSYRLPYTLPSEYILNISRLMYCRRMKPRHSRVTVCQSVDNTSIGSQTL